MDDPDLQIDGSEAGHRVRKVLALADQRLERVSLAAGSVEVDHFKPDLGVPELKLNDRHLPALGALPNKFHRGRMFLAGVGEGDDQIAQVIVVVQHLAQHEGAGPPAGEAHDGSR